MSEKIKKDAEAPKEVGRFVGPRKVVVAVVEKDIKTNGGNDVVNVTFEGGYTQMMPKSSFETVVSEAPTDYNVLQGAKLAPLTLEILEVIAEHDLTAGDIEALKQSIERELYNSFNRATHYLWTKDDKSFIPGNNVVMERSLLEADVIIKSIKPNAEDTKPKSEEAAK